MPQNKRMLFPLDDQYTSRYAQALCHPARLKIVALLRHRVFMMHKEIEERLPLSGSTVSQHLDRLESVEMIEKAVIAGVVVYQINRAGVQQAKYKLETYLAKVG